MNCFLVDTNNEKICTDDKKPIGQREIDSYNVKKTQISNAFWLVSIHECETINN